MIEVSDQLPNLVPELELIQSQMAQKPVLRGDVGARALHVRSVSREDAWASADVQGGGCECEATSGALPTMLG